MRFGKSVLAATIAIGLSLAAINASASSGGIWRRLLVCGEWIESHALHVHLLHAPDFLGYPDGLRMAKDHPEAVQRGLGIKKAGKDLLTLLGGREIHPINVRVGGCYRAPRKQELERLREQLPGALEASMETVRWVAGLPFPNFERDYTFVALRHSTEYPMNHGRIVSSSGWDLPVDAYEDHFIEEQVAYSHALHSVARAGGAYLVGPLARYNLNFDRLSPLAQETAQSAGLGRPNLPLHHKHPPCTRPLPCSMQTKPMCSKQATLSPRCKRADNATILNLFNRTPSTPTSD